jgi:hypothetical protein
MFLVAVGCLLMAFIHAASTWTVLLPGFVVTGVGIGTVNPVLASSAVSVVSHERSGMASGTNNTFRQVGIATGIAALGAVFQSQMTSKVTAGLASTPAGRAAAEAHGSVLRTAFTSGQVRTAVAHLPAAQSDAVLAAYRAAFASTLDHLMAIGAVLALLGSIAGFALVRQRDFVPSFAPAGPSDGQATEADPAWAG